MILIYLLSVFQIVYGDYEVHIKDSTCNAYIVGDHWALASKNCVSDLNNQVQLVSLHPKAEYNVEKIFDTKDTQGFEHLNVFLMKTRNSMSRQGMVNIYSNMPAEEMTLFTTKNESLIVTEYEECYKTFGNKTGIFCSTNRNAKSKSTLGEGLFSNGMLAGISITTTDNILSSVSTAFITQWILDTMSFN